MTLGLEGNQPPRRASQTDKPLALRAASTCRKCPHPCAFLIHGRFAHVHRSQYRSPHEGIQAAEGSPLGLERSSTLPGE
jgi:hypothetical protein